MDSYKNLNLEIFFNPTPREHYIKAVYLSIVCLKRIMETQVFVPIIYNFKTKTCMHLVEKAFLCYNYLGSFISLELYYFYRVNESHVFLLKFRVHFVITWIEDSCQVIADFYKFYTFPFYSMSRI